jgi:alanyl-tRNA synthetase
MIPDKVIKEQYKPIFWKNPEQYYATQVLKEEGFQRGICQTCKKPFWSTTQRLVCGDSACSGEGFNFIGKSPAKNKLGYVQVYQEFSKMFKKLGYTPVSRYPTVARWNPTMEYTNASIAAFQPFVISGEVDPPAKRLVIPQFVLRFSDTDNVGITMSHHTGFVMIGQHLFVQPDEWDQNEIFSHMYKWNREGLGLDKKDMTFHEDAWAGGGNLGPCMEMFSKGNELWNQVYMLHEQTATGVKDLKIKVLDMGLGMERNAWFSQGCPTIYNAAFPLVVNKLQHATGIKVDDKIVSKFVPNAGLLNNDETDDMGKAWKTVAKNVGVEVKELKQDILPLSHIFSIGEHMRSALFVLADGGLPSNVGGGYNLRMLIRRSLGFIDKNEWNIDINAVTEWHAEYLKKMYPELKESLDDVHKILDVEKIKYENTKQKTARIVATLKDFSEEKLLQLYDSQGISPEMIPGVKTPEEFYKRVAELHEQKAINKAATNKREEIEIKDLEPTKALYYDDYKLYEFKAKVLQIEDNFVILEKTAFYPTSGGQMHDRGTINECEVLEVFKQGPYIVHKVEAISFKVGDIINGIIDKQRRIQLSQHHTATHIINTAARKVLGNHINQAGAFKDIDKARIDITHYESLTEQETQYIEQEANKIISQQIPIEKNFYPRAEAEKLFGVNIYQGGVAPGRMLRIVNIKGLDVQACGGTHLDNTREAEHIKIIKTSKIQDGIVRITFTAGAAAKKEEKIEEEIIMELTGLLGCDDPREIPSRSKELFSLWKKVVKKKKTGVEKKLSSTEKWAGDTLDETAKVLKTQQEHLVKTVKRFLKELGM